MLEAVHMVSVCSGETARVTRDGVGTTVRLPCVQRIVQGMTYAMLVRASARVTQAGVVNKESSVRENTFVMKAGLGRTAMSSRAQTNVFSRKGTENCSSELKRCVCT